MPRHSVKSRSLHMHDVLLDCLETSPCRILRAKSLRGLLASRCRGLPLHGDSLIIDLNNIWRRLLKAPLSFFLSFRLWSKNCSPCSGRQGPARVGLLGNTLYLSFFLSFRLWREGLTLSPGVSAQPVLGILGLYTPQRSLAQGMTVGPLYNTLYLSLSLFQRSRDPASTSALKAPPKY